MYYDLRSDRAVLLDAVFWTCASRGMPLYLRAESIRKESDNQFAADNARLANVAFADPHFSIGADSVTLTRRLVPTARSPTRSTRRASASVSATSPFCSYHESRANCAGRSADWHSRAMRAHRAPDRMGSLFDPRRRCGSGE